MIKLLIGGSPCTYWSVVQKKNREVTAEGLGWELFCNYLIAKKNFKPDFFLYENNWSAAQPIKNQISRELGVPLMHINSALVSAQNRHRFYAFNWNTEVPSDREIMLNSILDTTAEETPYILTHLPAFGVGYRNRREEDEKLYRRFESSCNPKANALTTVKTDSMIAIPVKEDAQSLSNFYVVSSNQIEIKGRMYRINLPDGNYVIRHFTINERERLQTLPVGYTKAASETQRVKQLGNGWTAEVIIHLLSEGLKNVPKDEPLIALSMYDGIGTGRYCLDKMGFTNVTYYAYEIDKPAMTVALSNYSDIIECGDTFGVREPEWTL